MTQPLTIDEIEARITGETPIGQPTKRRKPSVELIEGDCRKVLAELDASSVDAVVTDPPYGLEFMGKDWDAPWKTDRRQTFDGTLTDNRENPFGRARIRNGSGQSYGADARVMQAFQEWCTDWAAELLRVLKPGGHILAFGGSRTYHRLASAIEDAGFEIRDQIMWLYGSGFPKSSNQNGDWDGWGTALKPAHEPIVVARKPLIGTMAKNLAAHGVGALNIDGCRVATDELTPRNNSNTATLLQKGFEGTPKTIEPSPLGRWPANVIHDGSDEVLDAFPAAPGQLANESRSAPSAKTSNVYGAMKRQNEPSQDDANEGTVGFKMKPGARRLDSGSAARFFYCAKASKADRDVGMTTPPKPVVTFATANGTSGKPSSISEGRNTEYRNTHPTVKPTSLMRYLTRLVTPPGGTVLDPFMGSGSTGRGAVLEGFNFIGIDMSTEYVDIADARIAAAEAEYMEQ